MYGKGGWVVVPATERGLPIKKLTPKQQTQNEVARRRHEAKAKAFERDTERLFQKYGVSFEADFPDFEPPNDPNAYDFEAFTEADWAIYNYSEKNGGRWESESPEMLRYLKKVIDTGTKVEMTFGGMSGGSMDDFQDKKIAARDGPKNMPDWLREAL